MNVIAPVGTPRQRLSAGVYRQELAARARQYGFGFVDRKRAVRSSLHAGRYIAKYLTEGGKKLGIGDLAARGDCPRVIARVDPHLTHRTGVTMRWCRRERGIFLLAAEHGWTVAEARAVRVKVSKLGELSWRKRECGGRSRLPWDVQVALAGHERHAAAMVAEWRQNYTA